MMEVLQNLTLQKKPGFSKSGIYRCLKGLSEHYKGYIWYGQ